MKSKKDAPLLTWKTLGKETNAVNAFMVQFGKRADGAERLLDHINRNGVPEGLDLEGLRAYRDQIKSAGGNKVKVIEKDVFKTRLEILNRILGKEILDIHETLPSGLLQSLQDTARYYASSGSLHSIWQLAKRGFLFEEFQKNGIDYDYLDRMIKAVSNEKAKCVSSAITLTKIKGRLLIFDPCATMYDGISEEISGGFFDADDVPPPEFWVGLYTNRLVSFIPVEYFDVVDEAIEISMSGCLEWLGDNFSINI